MSNELSSSADSPVIPAPGATDAYRLGERLHAGSTGEIYEAEHPWLPGRYAIKVLATALSQVPQAVQTFRAELASLADTRHPNIVQVLETGVLPDGRAFVIMERLEGRTLADRVADGKPLPLYEVLPLVRSISGALQAAHARAVVHRELSLDNIFLASADGYEQGFVKLLNFGIARLRNTSGADAGVGAEAARTMAPEQAQGRSDDVDASTDQFALGAVVYRLLAGTDAFKGDDFIAVLYQVVHQDPPPLPGVSTHVDAVVRRALAKDRGNRHDSVTAFYQALKDAARKPPVEVVARPEAPAAGQRLTAEMRTSPRTIEARPIEPRPALARTENGKTSSRSSDSLGFAGTARPAGGGVLAVEPPWSTVGVGDEIVPSDELYIPRSRWRLLVLFAAFLLPIIAAALWTGWQPPLAWRQSQIWQALHLPGAVTPSGWAAPPSDKPPEGNPPAVIPAGPADASPDSTPDSSPALTAPPDASAPPPDAAAHATVVRPRKRAAAPAPAPVHKDMVWSDRLQRLVPADGSEDHAPITPPPTAESASTIAPH
jgi:serine/threonine protein kinase